MRKLFLLLKESPWSLIGSIASGIGISLALIVQFGQTTAETEIRQIRSEIVIHEYKELNKKLETRIAKIEDSLPIPDNLLQQSAFSGKLKEVESKIEKVEQSTLALRQAVNPLKPEEVLTIARLTDEIVALKKDYTELKNTTRKDQDSFEQSMLREAKSSNQSTMLILVVLIPLVLNFLYTVWKDLKETNKEKP